MAGIGHNKPQVSIQGLSPDDRKTLRKGILEMNDSMTRIDAEKELIKETVGDLNDKLGVDKKLIRKLAAAYFKANYKQVIEENTEFEEFYDAVIHKTTD